jgi:hypothetical protein
MSNKYYINQILSPVLTGDNITQIGKKHKLKNRFNGDNNANGEKRKAGEK